MLLHDFLDGVRIPAFISREGKAYAGEFASSTDLRPVQGQDPWDKCQQDALSIRLAVEDSQGPGDDGTYNPSQQTRRTRVCQIGEHEVRDEWENASEDIPTCTHQSISPVSLAGQRVPIGGAEGVQNDCAAIAELA